MFCVGLQPFRPECFRVPGRRIVRFQHRNSRSDPGRSYVTGGGIGMPFRARLARLGSLAVDAASVSRTAE